MSEKVPEASAQYHEEEGEPQERRWQGVHEPQRNPRVHEGTKGYHEGGASLMLGWLRCVTITLL